MVSGSLCDAQAWGLAEKMIVRIAMKDVTLAFNTWAGHFKAARAAKETLRTSIKLWQGGTVRAFRCWKSATAQRHEARRKKRWMQAAIQKPELRHAMNRWLDNTRDTHAAKSTVGRVLGSWRNKELAAHFRIWRGATTFGLHERRRGGAVAMSPREQRSQQQLYLQMIAELMARPCAKAGRYTGRWRLVSLSLGAAGLSYASGSSYQATKCARTRPPGGMARLCARGDACMGMGRAVRAVATTSR